MFRRSRSSRMGLGAALLVWLSLMLTLLEQTASATILDTTHYNGHTYYLISENSWTGAAAESQTLGGYLATINNQAEQDHLWNAWHNSLGTGEGLWIGLERTAVGSSVFVWMNGEPLTFTFWAPGEPNNGVGHWYEGHTYHEEFGNMDSRFSSTGMWNDLPNEGADWMNERGIVEVNNPGSSEISTPEVSTLVLLGSGLAGLVLRGRRRLIRQRTGLDLIPSPSFDKRSEERRVGKE